MLLTDRGGEMEDGSSFLQRVCVSQRHVNKVQRVTRRADVSVAARLLEGDRCDCFFLATVLSGRRRRR